MMSQAAVTTYGDGDSDSPRATQAAQYLLGIPLLGDYLEEGLSLFGHSYGALWIERL
jgi:hypothetical protein